MANQRSITWRSALRVRVLGSLAACVAGAAFIAGAAAPGDALAQTAACVVYEHSQYKGSQLQLGDGQGYRRLNRWNNRISSVRVAQGCTVNVGSEADFGGNTRTFDKNTTYVGSAWNDKITSLQCQCGGDAWRNESVQDQSRVYASSACTVYEDPSFGGASLELRSGQEYARLNRWNDRIESIAVQRGCQLTVGEHHNFRGDRATVTENVGDLGRNWNRRISALYCECSGQQGQFGRTDRQASAPEPSADGAACIVYEDSRFRGGWRAFERGDEDETLGRRLNDRVSSVKVASGCVALLDVGLPYKLWVEQDVSALGGAADNSAGAVSCFCPRRWRR